MKKKLIGGFTTLALGVMLVAGSYASKAALSADQLSSSASQTIAIALFLGIALIILSAILFIKASGVDETK